MVTRRKVVGGGALAALAATLPFGSMRRVFAASPPSFDFYISPTGDDNNPGTLSSPWSITALNSKQLTYAGKRIGLLPGIYQYGTVAKVQTTLYSIYQGLAANSIWCTLAINGGPSGTQPTYLASSDASGNYSPRTAIIDCSDPATGSLPTVENSVLGQSAYNLPMPNPVHQFGNVTIDGIVIRNFTFAALVFSGYESIGQYCDNVVIQNCELYNAQNVKSNNNPGAIWAQWANNLKVANCKIHDLQSNAVGSSDPYEHFGYIQFHSFGTSITNCTFYNCCAISNKDGWQSMDVSYCYCGWGPSSAPYSRTANYMDDGGTIMNYLCGTGVTVNFHHNIVCGPMQAWGESGQMNEGTVIIYNNTFFKYGGIGGKNSGLIVFEDFCTDPNSGGTGTFQFYNNLVYAADGNYDNTDFSAGCFNKMGAKTGGTWSTLTNCDYNVYGSGMNFGQDWSSGDSGWSLPQWQGYGYDAHSRILSSSPFARTPVEPDSSSFGISGPASTAGKGGVACGAVDGTGLVGCDFAAADPPPSAPILGTVT